MVIEIKPCVEEPGELQVHHDGRSYTDVSLRCVMFCNKAEWTQKGRKAWAAYLRALADDLESGEDLNRSH